MSLETRKRISHSLIGHSVSKESRKKMSQKHKGKVLSEETKKKIGAFQKGRKLSDSIREKMSKAATVRSLKYKGKPLPWQEKMIKNAPKGDKSYNWKGEKVTYRALHAWIERKLGRPDKCAHCGLEGFKGREIHWANISKEYKRDLKDWIRLCRVCHFNYDKLMPKGNIKKRYVK